MLHRVDHDVLENLYLTPQNGHFCPRHQFEKCPDFPTNFYHFEIPLAKVALEEKFANGLVK